MTQILFCLGEKSFGNVLLFEKPLLELYLWLVFDYYVCVGNCCTDIFVCMSKATSKKRHLTWYRLTIFKVFIQSFEFWWVFVSILFVCLFSICPALNFWKGRANLEKNFFAKFLVYYYYYPASELNCFLHNKLYWRSFHLLICMFYSLICLFIHIFHSFCLYLLSI